MNFNVDINVGQEFNSGFLIKLFEQFHSSVHSEHIKRVNNISDSDITNGFANFADDPSFESLTLKTYEFPQGLLDYNSLVLKCFYEDKFLLKYILVICQINGNSKYKNVYVFSREKIDNTMFSNFLSSYSLEEHEEIDWCYPAGGGYHTIKLPLKKQQSFLVESYPFIKNLETWIDNYLNSNSSILILNGPPGTGKSTLISHIISKAKLKVMTAFDEKVMRSDNLYINFISGEHDLLILEDADLVLMDRLNKDNDVMSKVLNVSEGIINVGFKKIIFTSNLNNLDVIDSAVRRPGRCYDIVDFRNLTFEEANVIRRRINKPEFKNQKSYTLAEVYTY